MAWVRTTAKQNNALYLVTKMEDTMEQSQKTGLRSDAQKQQRARQGYDPVPPANPVAGAHGEHRPDRASDQEVSLGVDHRKNEDDEG